VKAVPAPKDTPASPAPPAKAAGPSSEIPNEALNN